MTNELATFAELELSSVLLQALTDMNFQTPSPVQTQTIPHLLQGRDVIAQAQTGTGKTAAFALPILQRLKKSAATQALVLAPTRELAIQVAEQFTTLAVHQKDTAVSVLCGGQDYAKQLKQLRAGAQVVVGTPGRILDHLDRGTLKLDNLTTFVLDEADEMLRMGFIEDVETILAKLPEEKQIALFSATMPHRIRQIANSYLHNPVSVEIRSETATVKSIEQRFLFASPPQKPDALIRVLSVEAFQGVIVFVRTKNSTEEVAASLQQQGFRATAIHGDISQALRERIISQFRQGSIDILVATDVAARGLDVERVDLVINYDMPHDCETYVHRIGRTGRAGRSGTTILFTTPRESRILNTIERHTRQRIEKVMIPDNHSIQQAKQQRFMASITERLEHDNLPSYRKIITEFMQQNPEIQAVDIASAIALLMHKDRAWKVELPQLKQTPEKRYESRDREFNQDHKKNNRGSFDRNKTERKPFRAANFSSASADNGKQQELFRLDVGRVHGVKPGNIVGAIANEAGLQSRCITELKIHDSYSTVRLPKGMSKEVFHGLNKAWVCGRQLKLVSMESA